MIHPSLAGLPMNPPPFPLDTDDTNDMPGVPVNPDDKKAICDDEKLEDIKCQMNAKMLDICYVFDSTGSMDPYMTASKKAMYTIAEKLSGEQNYAVQYSLVAYKDHCDAELTKVYGDGKFTNDWKEMQAWIGTLKAEGGGDGPEAMAAGLGEALKIDWRENATKIVILISDAPPHGIEGKETDSYPDGHPDEPDAMVVLEDMKAKNIIVYPVGCVNEQGEFPVGKNTKDFFMKAAEITNGQAIALTSAEFLGNVIIGASAEEMGLELIKNDVKKIEEEIKSQNPDIDNATQKVKVLERLHTMDMKVPHMSGGNVRLQSDSFELVANVSYESLASFKKDVSLPSIDSEVPASVPPPLGRAVSVDPVRIDFRLPPSLSEVPAPDFCMPPPLGRTMSAPIDYSMPIEEDLPQYYGDEETPQYTNLAAAPPSWSYRNKNTASFESATSCKKAKSISNVSFSDKEDVHVMPPVPVKNDTSFELVEDKISMMQLTRLLSHK